MKAPLAHKLWVGVAVLASLAVFMLYTQPDFMVQLSNQIWACF